MPAYAYPIKIEYNRKKINFQTIHRIEDDPISIEILKPIVKDNKFDIEYNDPFYVITVHEIRDETDEEMKERIERGERYMKEHNRRKKLRS